MYKNDWIMTEITKAIKFLLLVLFNKKETDLEYLYTSESPRYKLQIERLNSLVEEGRALEAENLLFETEDPEDMVNLQIGLWFYNRMNQMDEDSLENLGFSRNEIKDGLRDLLRYHGLDEYAETIT